MPRIRSLKPEIVSDVKLNSVSMDAELTFVKMITQSDDAGLLSGAPRPLLGALYPLRESVTVPLLLGWIEELVTAGLVRWRATRDGVPVLQIINWHKHQRIDNAGRSQLGALLAESPAESPAQPAGSGCGSPQVAEDRGDSPRLAAVRGLDHRPPITDQGSPTTDRAAACVRLSVAANNGLAQHPARPQPIPRILPNAGNTLTAVERILDAGVPLSFAEAKVFNLALTHNADGTISSLKYFVQPVLRAWEESKIASTPGSNPDPFIAGLEEWKRREDAKEAQHG